MTRRNVLELIAAAVLLSACTCTIYLQRNVSGSTQSNSSVQSADSASIKVDLQK